MDVMAESQDDMIYERLEQTADADNIRRCLANLTKLYRMLWYFYICRALVR